MKRLALLLVIIGAHLQISGAPASHDFIAHEWGTFTSVQGADGVLLEWNPLVTTDLPKFVYNSTKPLSDPRLQLTLFSGKDGLRTLQRMETPVIYFYSPTEQSVDVTVGFPQGRITEWFPQASEIGPAIVRPEVKSTGARVKDVTSSMVRWKNIQLLPGKDQATLIPADGSQSHYYAARDTDASIVRFNNAGKAEHEKFLFYRGVGSFGTPLTLTLHGAQEENLVLRNTGKEQLKHLFVLNIRDGMGAFSYNGSLKSGTDTTVKLDALPTPMPISQLASAIDEKMRQSLVEEGLYAAEAQAMVNTWSDSWFQESGVRVLYVLPSAWTARTLPIKFEPAPKELVRVMVGRAEMITPRMEWEALKQIVRYTDMIPEQKDKVVSDFRALDLGRFAEPVIRRVLGRQPNQEFSQAAMKLLETTRPDAKSKALAAN